MAIHPYKSFKVFELSNHYKISRLGISGLKIGNLANFIMLFPFLATNLLYHLLLWLTWPCDHIMQRAYNIKSKISVINTSVGLRQSSGDYRKYLLTFRSCSKLFRGPRVIFWNIRQSSGYLRKSLEGFGSSSEIIGGLRVNFVIFGSPRAILGNLRSNLALCKLTKNALS